MNQTSVKQAPISLLYVEDEKDARTILLSMLQAKFPSLQLTVAENGAEGFEAYSLFNSDILVTDISMPQMNGLQMARKIKEVNPEVQIIVLTGRTDTQYLLDSIDIGINHYVVKPVDNALLFAAIEKCIDSISLKLKVKEQHSHITDLNARLTARTEELEMLNRELEAFNYTVSHDLRTPLSVINGYCQVLTELCSSNLDSSCRSFVKEITNGVYQMNDLITTLLNFSKVNRFTLRKTNIDLSKIVAEVSNDLKVSDQDDRQVDFRISQNVTAIGDKTLLKLLLQNLIGNSWKYTSNKEMAIIEFGLSNINKKPVFYVRDNGIGFDSKHSIKMFTPFQRLNNGESFEGTGIGLATVQRIVHRHGGVIWAEGEVEKGATFYFTLEEGVFAETPTI
jgi:signal transduction histidine kinase